MNLFIVATALALLFQLVSPDSMEMGTCKMVCDNATFPVATALSPLAEQKKSESCTCPDPRALLYQIAELKIQVEKVNAPKDCSDVIERKASYRGGVYTIYPYETNERGEKVYCDTKTDGGGWIVFQRRMDGSEDFFRGWDDYVNGFGDLNGEFWLGLDKMYNIMKTGRYELRVDLEDFENNRAYAKYSTFELGGPDEFYPVTTSDYYGTAGNSLQLSKVPFSTKDKDNDANPKASCAKAYNGGMWYTNCHGANLNGLYLRGVTKRYATSVVWKEFKGFYYSLKFSEMKMRRKDY